VNIILKGALSGPELAIVDGRIASPAEAGISSDDTQVMDVSGCVITPGLVNAHHHLLQSAFRTLPGTRGVRMEQWLSVMGRAYRDYRVDPELVFAAAEVGLAESLLNGVTMIADHHLTWPAGVDPVEIASATARAAAGIGARLCFVRGTTGEDADSVVDSVHRIHRAFGEIDDGKIAVFGASSPYPS